ncbi:MAG: hypothetical protein E4H20_10350, partial [Spirochaetales bacterium]
MAESFMPMDALAWAAGLLTPVLVLMFVALRLRRRVRYPHALLNRSDRTVRADFLPRSLRLYYDSVLDAVAALVVALAIAGFPPPAASRTAVVLDCSRSMLSGERGDRALDKAAAFLFTGPDLADAKFFLLGYDMDAHKPTLSDGRRLREASASAIEL